MSRISSPLSLCLLLLLAACSQVIGGKPQAVEDVSLVDGDAVDVLVWIENLEIPWSLVFLPDGRALVSERPGRIPLIQDGKLRSLPYAEPEVAHIGEGGLMGKEIGRAHV